MSVPEKSHVFSASDIVVNVFLELDLLTICSLRILIIHLVIINVSVVMIILNILTYRHSKSRLRSVATSTYPNFFVPQKSTFPNFLHLGITEPGACAKGFSGSFDSEIRHSTATSSVEWKYRFGNIVRKSSKISMPRKYIRKTQRQSWASQEDPVLLILDGHLSHTKNIDVILKARENFVTLLCLPPYTTHKLQPLDVGVMFPFNAYMDQALETWMNNHPGRTVTAATVVFTLILRIESLKSKFRKA
ncbi:hypothetical protein NQ318_001302 [Aromia moschata]|uniref:DDE-1 domain-containing protein n=1 Tax=Aromia moschata TaxID=1265417 RepID=A0AAV8ZHV7_9CUCU|nr:hypothetical protein NQ318_001302 [Aromia moschata]